MNELSKNLSEMVRLSKLAQGTPTTSESLLKMFNSQEDWYKTSMSISDTNFARKLAADLTPPISNKLLTDYTENWLKEDKSISNLEFTRKLATNLDTSIPEKSFRNILSIVEQQERLFPKFFFEELSFSRNQKMGQMAMRIPISLELKLFSSIYNLQSVLNSVISPLVVDLIKSQQWDSLGDFEEILLEASNLSDEIFRNEGLTSDQIKESFDLLNQKIDKLSVSLNEINSKIDSPVWKFIQIIGFILALTSEIRNYIPQKETLKKEDVRKIIREEVSTSMKTLKDYREYKTISKSSQVRMFSKHKSEVIDTLPQGYKVIVIDHYKNWVLISYHHSADSLLLYGWVTDKNIE